MAFPEAIAKPGQIDGSFNAGQTIGRPVHAGITDDQSRTILAGGFTSYNGTETPRILRVDADGRIDKQFKVTKGPNGPVKALAFLSDGRVLVGGQFTTFDGQKSMGLALLGPDGGLDPQFRSGFEATGFSVGVTCVEVLPGDQIVVGGYFTRYGGADHGRYVIIDESGKIANESTDEGGADSHVLDIDHVPGHGILISGFFKQVGDHKTTGVARLNLRGVVDKEFQASLGEKPVVYSVAGNADGKVIVGGNLISPAGDEKEYRLAGLDARGVPDPDFKLDDTLDSNVYAVGFDPTGNLIIAGQFTTCGGKKAGGICRLSPLGELDRSFSFAGPVNASFIQEYPIDSSGRIVCYGWRSMPIGEPIPEVIRVLGK